MKLYKCPQCLRETEAPNDTKFSICKGCLTSMNEVSYNSNTKVEVRGDHERNKIYTD